MTQAYQESFAEPERIRLNLISEVALAADGAARPIHILRTGTFTGMSGKSVTFSADHIRSIVANFQAGKRKKPPITERHDWGRAIGRMLDVYSDATGENLYSLPRWTADGRQMLSEEIYDGFSVELDADDAGGFVLIGGSLTNYPAVDGLEPVTLSLPPIETSDEAPPAPAGARADTDPLPQITTEEHIMSDTPLEQAALPGVPPTASASPPAALPLPPLPSDSPLADRQATYLAQIEARAAAREQAAYERASAEFDRRIQTLEQRNTVDAFARARTVTTAEQPYAIPMTAEELATLLLETPAAVRGKWQQLLSRITANGLVSFDEIGSSGEAEVTDRRETLINQKIAAGMSRFDAIRAVDREHTDLYNAQARVKRGGR